MSCGVGRRCSSDLALLSTATTLIQPLVWEPPKMPRVKPKKKKKKKKKTPLKVFMNIKGIEVGHPGEVNLFQIEMSGKDSISLGNIIIIIIIIIIILWLSP